MMETGAVDPVQRLLAIEAIKQLKARHFRCMDSRDWAGLRAVFCDDAVFDARGALSLDGARGAGWNADWVYRGGAAITDFVRDTAGPWRTVHHGHGHEIALLSATDARGVIAVEDQIWAPDSGASYLHGCGYYHEDYRMGSDGWRILTSRLTRLHIALGPAAG
ncbi:MAG TPA: nuclear transport factor 2 family protein [Sphingomonas sp.]|jgi:hypothetical protein|uniref:nuclear transport factor 2 family protein n=1 Tax=Sphingomonas sp. TaxID=28214 RepID=UPI002ED89A77